MSYAHFPLDRPVRLADRQIQCVPPHHGTRCDLPDARPRTRADPGARGLLVGRHHRSLHETGSLDMEPCDALQRAGGAGRPDVGGFARLYHHFQAWRWMLGATMARSPDVMLRYRRFLPQPMRNPSWIFLIATFCALFAPAVLNLLGLHEREDSAWQSTLYPCLAFTFIFILLCAWVTARWDIFHRAAEPVAIYLTLVAGLARRSDKPCLSAREQPGFDVEDVPGLCNFNPSLSSPTYNRGQILNKPLVFPITFRPRDIH
ncbi:hypothetical protein B0H17DRAFT_517404 [Mycena rosella]|uniref:Uncharacterized protein n=1 Tax=Mycena rosella TaxID=1033263 RepID=A0AAD7GXC6_MYCRO|nr:hypothetical protein B0H17DRAFT_517404 [Mycena rosella]